LPLKIEIAPDRAEFREKADEILQAAPEPIDRPCSDNVDLAGGCGPQQPVEARALFSTLGAADPLSLELFDNPPAPRLAYGDQPDALRLDGLLARRHPQIQPDPLAVHHSLHIPIVFVSVYVTTALRHKGFRGFRSVDFFRFPV
jgi:hypothetical protein